MKNLELMDEFKEIKKFIQDQNDHDEIIDMNAASKYLNVSKSFLYKLTSSRKIPFYRPSGKKIFFSLNELKKWVKQKPCKSKKEIDEKAMSYIDRG